MQISDLHLLTHQAELTIEQFIPMIFGAVITGAGFLASRFYTRMDADRDELTKLREFAGAQKKENKRLWEVIDELRKK